MKEQVTIIDANYKINTEDIEEEAWYTLQVKGISWAWQTTLYFNEDMIKRLMKSHRVCVLGELVGKLAVVQKEASGFVYIGPISKRLRGYKRS